MFFYNDFKKPQVSMNSIEHTEMKWKINQLVKNNSRYTNKGLLHQWQHWRGHGNFFPQSLTLPPLPPSQKTKNEKKKNLQFSQKFWNFAPSYPPCILPTQGPPLKNFWCYHCPSPKFHKVQMRNTVFYLLGLNKTLYYNYCLNHNGRVTFIQALTLNWPYLIDVNVNHRTRDARGLKMVNVKTCSDSNHHLILLDVKSINV